MALVCINSCAPSFCFRPQDVHSSDLVDDSEDDRYSEEEPSEHESEMEESGDESPPIPAPEIVTEKGNGRGGVQGEREGVRETIGDDRSTPPPLSPTPPATCFVRIFCFVVLVKVWN